MPLHPRHYSDPFSLSLALSPELSRHRAVTQLTRCDRGKISHAACFRAIHSHNFRRRLAALFGKPPKCSPGTYFRVFRVQETFASLYAIQSYFCSLLVVCWNSNCAPRERFFFFVAPLPSSSIFFVDILFSIYLNVEVI